MERAGGRSEPAGEVRFAFDPSELNDATMSALGRAALRVDPERLVTACLVRRLRVSRALIRLPRA
jgi:hypothetical protein